MPADPRPTAPYRPTRHGPFGFSKVVFLSHVHTPEMPIFPGDPTVDFRTAATLQTNGFYLQYVGIGEQSGTHWAAASHFGAGEAHAGELDAADFFHPAAIIDIRDRARSDHDLELSVDDISAFEAISGSIPVGAMVCLRTGFDERWENPPGYLNAGPDGTPHHPGFGSEAVRWLIDQRDIGGLGIDALGIDRGIDGGYSANRTLLRGHRIHLENLTGLRQMPPLGGWIVVGGMRNYRGSGSPATVFGLVP